MTSVLGPEVPETANVSRRPAEGAGRSAAGLGIESDARAVQQQLAVPRPARHAAPDGLVEGLGCDGLWHDAYTFSRSCSSSQVEDRKSTRPTSNKHCALSMPSFS